MTDLAEQAAALFGITLTSEQVSQFAMYARELVEWNTRVNLTAITESEAITVRHFLDSLSVVAALNYSSGLRVIDVGTGAGFPGLPLKIIYPDLRLTLLEATGKKIAFLDHLVSLLGLRGVDTLHARAEDAGHMSGRRAAYDRVLARSVARLPSLLEYMLPLARVGGRCIAMKGVTAQTESADSKKALHLLGGHITQIIPVTLPGVSDAHNLIVIEKAAGTPAAYPRKPGTPTQKPLV
jgi:16S rRNA (guanine527-N7)-methyltransferase